MQDHIDRLHRRLEDVRSPKIAAMQDHISRLHRRLAERDERIKELEEGGEDGSEDGSPGALADALKQSRLRAAFLQHVIQHPEKIDVETAWDLGNVRGFFDVVSVPLTPDGEVSGMDKAFGAMMERYPWVADGFVDEDADETPKAPPRPKTGTSPRSKIGNGQMNSSAMRERFPALRNRKK